MCVCVALSCAPSLLVVTGHCSRFACNAWKCPFEEHLCDPSIWILKSMSLPLLSCTDYGIVLCKEEESTYSRKLVSTHHPAYPWSLTHTYTQEHAVAPINFVTYTQIHNPCLWTIHLSLTFRRICFIFVVEMFLVNVSLFQDHSHTPDHQRNILI